VLGPILELPEETYKRIGEAMERDGISVGYRDDALTFREQMALIDGRMMLRGEKRFVHLCFTRKHAFNPLLWAFDFRLVGRVERRLIALGARSVQWDAPPSELK